MNEQRLIAILNGRDASAAARLLRPALSAAALGYGAVIRVRNAWYDWMPGATAPAAAPVISIGNITTGGTGKTPLAAKAAAHLISIGRRVAVLTRGYKGRPAALDSAPPRQAQAAARGESDEAELLRRLCPAVRVVVHPDRRAAGRAAVSAGCNALILDDGFQHRRLRRDLDIVLIDATAPFGLGRMLPRGLLREPLSALRRAHLLVLSRCDQVTPNERSALIDALRRIAPDRPILPARHAVTGFQTVGGLRGEHVDPSAFEAVIFAGIANFAAFQRTVEALGVRVRAAYEFPDHHVYTDAEIAELPHAAAQVEANVLLTTEKDAVKLIGRWPQDGCPLLAPRIEMLFEDEGEALFRQHVERAVSVERLRPQ